MSLTPEDIQKLSTAMSTAIGKAMSAALSGDRTARAKEEKTAERTSTKRKDFSSPKQLEEYIKKQASASFSGIADSIDTIIGGFQKIYEQEIFTNKELDKAFKNTIKTMSSMEDMVGSSGDALLKLADDGDGMGEVFKILKKRVEGAATLQKELSEAQSNGTELSVWWLKQLGKQMGVTKDRLKELEKKGAVALKDELIKIGEESNTVVKRLSENAVMHKRVIEGNKILSKGAQALAGKFGLANVSIAGFTALGAASFNKLYSAVTAGVQAQIPANNILNILTDSLTKFGVPIEDLTKAITESRIQIAQTDYDTFIKGLDASADRLRNEGVAAKDALEMATAFRQNALSAGISARETDRMNASVQSQEKEFLKLSRVTGMTAKEYIEFSKAAAENTDLQKINLGFSVKERAARIESFRAQSVLLQTTYGLSKAQAEAAQSALLSIQKDKVTSRLEQAARVQQMAAILGMGDAGAAAAETIRLGRRATDEQRTSLAKFMGTMNESAQTLALGGLAEENVVNVLEEGMGGGSKQLYDAGVALQSATGKMLSDSEVISAMQRNAADKTLANGIETFTFIKNAMENPIAQLAVSAVGLTASIVAGSGSLIAAGSSLMAAAAALSASAGIPGGGMKGAISKGAGVAGRLAKLAGPAAGVMAAGAAGYAVGEGINKLFELGTGTSIGSSLYDLFGGDKSKELLAPSPIPTAKSAIPISKTQQIAIPSTETQLAKTAIVATPTEINTVNQQSLNQKLVDQQAEMITILRSSENISREIVEILKTNNDQLKVVANKSSGRGFETRPTLSKPSFVGSAMR